MKQQKLKSENSNHKKKNKYVEKYKRRIIENR